MRSIMGQIEPEHPELFALEFGKIAEYNFVYTLTSTNFNQSAPMAESDFLYTLTSTNINQSALNLVKMYLTIRSPMSSIIDLIGPELSELFALELLNLTFYTLVSTNIDQSVTNLTTILYAYKVLDEFDYRTNRTRTSGVICP